MLRGHMLRGHMLRGHMLWGHILRGRILREHHGYTASSSLWIRKLSSWLPRQSDSFRAHILISTRWVEMVLVLKLVEYWQTPPPQYRCPPLRLMEACWTHSTQAILRHFVAIRCRRQLQRTKMPVMRSDAGSWPCRNGAMVLWQAPIGSTILKIALKCCASQLPPRSMRLIRLGILQKPLQGL